MAQQRGTEDVEDPISQSTASSDDLFPASQSPLQPSPLAAAAAAADGDERRVSASQQAASAAADEEEQLDDLLDLLADSDGEPTPVKEAKDAAPPPAKRARRLPGWMAAAAPAAPAAAARGGGRGAGSGGRGAGRGRGGPSGGGGGGGGGGAGRQMERAFEEAQAKKRRKLEDAKSPPKGGSSGEPPLLLGVSVDPSATAANAAANPRQLTTLTRALFPPRVIVFDVETTGFAQDDVIVEIGAVELIGGVRTGVQFQSYIVHRKESFPLALEVHGLAPNFLASKPPPSLVIPAFVRNRLILPRK